MYQFIHFVYLFRMFDAALKSPLNKDDVQPAYEKYIKPILKLKGNL